MVYIKRIEISGFKSFAPTPITVKFTRGFNAIVGPNGSGKSNIIDAIQFVLGIKSTKALRLQNLSEVLFRPIVEAATTKPAEIAKVTIFFDNSDRLLPFNSSVVAISREVTADGKSVYRINDRAVTKTTLLNSLQALGISGESYNIVPQGKIAEIINMPPLGIRALIEYLSGISSFDEQKEKALKELNIVNQNLTSISVLVKESEKKLRILEKEKNDALLYADLKKQVDSLIMLLDKIRIRDLQNELAVVELKLQENIDKVETLLKSKKELKEKEQEIVKFIDLQEAELNNYRIKLDNYQEKINAISRERYKLETEFKIKENENTQLKNRRTELSNKLTQSQQDLEELNMKRDAILKNKNIIEMELEELISKRDVLKAQLESLNRDLGNFISSFKETDAQIADLQTIIFNKDQELNRINIDLTSVDGLLHELNKSASEIRASIETLTKKINDQQVVLEEKNAMKKQLDAKIDTMNRSLETINAEIKNKQELLESKKLERNNIKSRMDAYKEISARLTSQKKAIYSILELRDSKKIKGIIGTVNEILIVPEKYQKAIDAALGSRVNYIITDNEQTAIYCVNFLKESKIGRATFLPLSKIKSKKRNLNRSLLKKSGVLGFAKDLISYDNSFSTVVDLLLGNVLILQDLSVAKQIDDRTLRLVSLDGDIIEPSGIIHGGHFVPRKIDFGRVSETSLQHIDNEILTITRDLTNLRNERDTLQKNLSASKKELNELEFQIKQILFNLNSLNEEKKKLEDRLAKLDERILEYKSKLNELQETKASLVKEIESLNTTLEELEEKKAVLSTKLESKNVFQLNNELESLSNKINALKSTISDYDIQLIKIDETINTINNMVKEYIREIKDIDEKLENFDADMAPIKEKISTLVSQENELKKIRDGLKTEFEEFIQLIKKHNEKRNRIRQEIDEIEQKIKNLEISIERLKVKRENLSSKIEELIDKIPESEDLSDIDLETDPDDIREEIKNLEVKMSLLEPINHRAIYQYDEEKTNYDALYSNYQKFLNEKESILEFMRKIEQEKINAFMKTFRKVNENMKKIFGILSPGGVAFLELENPENPFLGGVFIKSKPAGKSITNPNSMSGGEKALTALALIFAIQQFSPTPFYIMDEIDAALDTRNAGRVASLIREFSKKSQFILVTLREVTMSKADRLIGVTQQDGSSKIVLLSFEDAKLTLKQSR